MSLVCTRELVDAARSSHTAVAAFNVINLEYAEAIAAAAESYRAPVIMQVSANAIQFHGGIVEPIIKACIAVAEEAKAPASVHLDHAEDLELCRRAVAAGCSSVMFDAGGGDPTQVVSATAAAAAWARSEGVWIEGELDEIGGKPGERASGKSEPARAVSFVASTGVDALAVAVGSRHKMTSAKARLDHELIARLRSAVSVPLVLHGSSGVPDCELRQAARSGISKINVGTRLSAAFTSTLRDRLTGAPTADPRAALGAARSAIETEAKQVLQALDSAPVSSS